MEYIINFDIENKDSDLLEKLIHKASISFIMISF